MYSNFDNVRVSKHSAFEWILNYGGKCMCICSYYTHFRPYYHSVDSTIKTVLYIFLHWYLYSKRDVCIHFVALLLHTKKQSVWKCELFFMFSLLMFFGFFAVSDVFKSMLFGNSGLMFFLSNSTNAWTRRWRIIPSSMKHHLTCVGWWLLPYPVRVESKAGFVNI